MADNTVHGTWIEKLIDFSVRNKFFVLIFVTMAIVASVWFAKNIPLDAATISYHLLRFHSTSPCKKIPNSLEQPESSSS